ncbi:MAG: hypothetical protein AB8B86_01655 [Pseudomonadales bacterium]
MMRHVARTYDMGIAAVMKSLLHSEAIDVTDGISSGHVSIAGGDHSYYITVPEQQLEKAQKVLRDGEFEKFLISE